MIQKIIKTILITIVADITAIIIENTVKQYFPNVEIEVKKNGKY